MRLEAPQADRGDHRPSPFVAQGAPRAAHLEPEGHVVEHAAPGKQVEVLPHHDRIGAQRMWGAARHRVFDPHRAGRRGLEPADDLDEGAFAAAAGAQDAGELARPEHVREAVESGDTAPVRVAPDLRQAIDDDVQGSPPGQLTRGCAGLAIVFSHRVGAQCGTTADARGSMGRTDYEDLRDFIERADGLGALRRIGGADPAAEIGGITEVAAGLPDCPALLFDDIKRHSRGFPIFTNAPVSPQRAALALRTHPPLRPLDALKEWKTRRTGLTLHKPVAAKHALFLENSRSAADVDVSLFPAPLWHQGDGGPFIGSGSIVVMRDPESGWINASIYRVQVHGRDRVTVQFDHQGRHGAIIARKYWEQGKPCPVAVLNGPDPPLFIAAFEYLPERPSAYNFPA